MSSRAAEITLDWADGTHVFRLGIAELEELEEKTGDGVFVIAEHLGPARTMHIRHVREVLRIGLIGGGKDPVSALRLVRRYLDERPIEESRDIAYAVVLAALARSFGDAAEPGDAPAGEPQGGERAQGSTLPPSTAPQA